MKVTVTRNRAIDAEFTQTNSIEECIKLSDDLKSLENWEDQWLMYFNTRKFYHQKIVLHPP